MLTFLVCLTALVIAYFTYGRYLERVAAIDPAHSVPSETLFDGVDYVPMPRWRVFLIQLLNIAGTGPIFGAILGAAFGPVAFLWITLGGIFMGAMHDFLSGVMLVRNDGLSIPEVAGRYLGTGMRQFMRLFSVVLLVLVGAVFLLSPADILSGMVPSVPHTVWVWLILAYYFVATLLPIDKIIGKDQIAVFHINDSKNPRGAAKDRHENIGLGSIGFDALYKVVWHKDFLDVPKILETPYVKSLADAKKAFPPYKEEIDMLRSGAYDAARITKLAE